MTGEDHDVDALIATLRSPALRSEREGETIAVAAMLDALSADPARPTGRRSGRGIAIAAVTVASLGVGGLVAAGPGVFLRPSVDRTPVDRETIDHDPTSVSTSDETQLKPSTTSVTTSTVPAAAAAAAHDAGVEHGDNPSITAPGLTGETPAVTAPGQTGDTPAVTAPGQTGDTPAVTAPAQSGDTPGVTAPAQSGETPAETAPGQTGENPSDTAPAQTGNGTGRP